MLDNVIPYNDATGGGLDGTLSTYESLNGTYEASTDMAAEGPYSIKIISETGGSAEIWSPMYSGFSAGQTVTATVTGRKTVGSAGTSVFVFIYFYNSTGGFISYATPSGTTAASSTQWRTATKVATTPANTAQIVLRFGLSGSTAIGSTVYIDKIGLWIGDDSEPWENHMTNTTTTYGKHVHIG